MFHFTTFHNVSIHVKCPQKLVMNGMCCPCNVVTIVNVDLKPFKMMTGLDYVSCGQPFSLIKLHSIDKHVGSCMSDFASKFT